MTEKQEREKRAKAALGTTGVCVLVFLILLLTSAWKSAGSGEGEYPGIEVNLGYDDQGSGNDQPLEPIGNEEAKDSENPPAQVVEESKQQTAAPTPVEDDADARIVQPTTVTDPNSDVEIKEEKKEVKPAEKPETKKIIEKPVEKKPVEKPKEVDKNAVYQGKKNTSSTTTGDGEGKQGTTGNEGDDTGKTGDKGVPGGTEGAAVYKGKPGGGDGGTLEINGWDWDHIPKPEVPDNETGRVVFEIEVDENGDLIGYRKESGSVSAAAERACIAVIQKLTLTKKSGAKVPPVTKGRITFVIRAQ
jgi:outer membrane biosynthesis protein TonB